MKKIILFLGLILFNNAVFGQNILKKGYLITCGEDKVVIINPDQSDENHSEIVWTWSTTEASDIPAEYQRLLVPLDECKPIFNNKKLLLTSSGGATIVLDIASRKVEFYAKTPMAHSADLLPNNRVAVANSTHKQGNSIEVYDMNKPEVVLFTDSLYSGHGAVWNEKQKLLYILGYQLLKVYSLADWESETPKLTLENSWTIPDKGGHDLSMIDPENFLISTHHNVFIFNTKTQKFTVFQPLKDRQNIKSGNYNPRTNKLVYTIAEESWWTHNIYLTSPSKRIHIPDIKLYKVRVAK